MRKSLKWKVHVCLKVLWLDPFPDISLPDTCTTVSHVHWSTPLPSGEGHRGAALPSSIPSWTDVYKNTWYEYGEGVMSHPDQNTRRLTLPWVIQGILFYIHFWITHTGKRFLLWLQSFAKPKMLNLCDRSLYISFSRPIIFFLSTVLPFCSFCRHFFFSREPLHFSYWKIICGLDMTSVLKIRCSVNVSVGSVLVTVFSGGVLNCEGVTEVEQCSTSHHWAVD